jgi:hypothetical protein
MNEMKSALKIHRESNGVLGNGVEKYIDVLTELTMFLRSNFIYIHRYIVNTHGLELWSNEAIMT